MANNPRWTLPTNVCIVDGEGNVISSFTALFDNYEYLGKKTSGNYVYYGFKEYGSTNWKIMRKDTTDDSAWKYAYSSNNSGISWTQAWSDPTALTYSDPPDS